MSYTVHYTTTSPAVFDTYEEVISELESRTDVHKVFRRDGVELPLLIEEVDSIGQKFSDHKLDMSKLFVQFPHACQAIVLASTFGNAKYHKTDDPETWDNFKKVPNGYNQFKSAEFRHEFLTQEEEESGLHPEFHILWNSLARYERWAMQNEVRESELAEKHIKNWYEKYGVNKG